MDGRRRTGAIQPRQAVPCVRSRETDQHWESRAIVPRVCDAFAGAAAANPFAPTTRISIGANASFSTAYSPADHLSAAPAATTTTAAAPASAPSSRAGYECFCTRVCSRSHAVSLLSKLLHNVQFQPARSDPHVYDAHGASRGTPAATSGREHLRSHPEFTRSPPEPRYDPSIALWGGFAGVHRRRKVNLAVDGKEYPQLAYGTATTQQSCQWTEAEPLLWLAEHFTSFVCVCGGDGRVRPVL